MPSDCFDPAQPKLPVPGAALAIMLVRARILLAGEGGIRIGDRRMNAELPGGAGYSVSIVDGQGQIFRRGSRALSHPLDLAKEFEFHSFMHNVDCCMFEEPRLPSVLPVYADALTEAAWSGDVGIRAFLEGADLDVRAPGRWMPWPVAYALAELGARSGSKDLRTMAGKVRDALDGAPQPAFGDLASLLRWGDLIERWAGMEPEEYHDDEFFWRRIHTGSGITACARRLDWLEGEVARLFVPPAEHRRFAQAMIDGTKPPGINFENPVYSFVEFGKESAIATIVDGEVVVRGPKGREGDYTDVTDFLREHLGMSAPVWRVA